MKVPGLPTKSIGGIWTISILTLAIVVILFVVPNIKQRIAARKAAAAAAAAGTDA